MACTFAASATPPPPALADATAGAPHLASSLECRSQSQQARMERIT